MDTSAPVPLWLLDFDGVINGSRAGWSAAPHSKWLQAADRAYLVRYSPALVSRIRGLVTSGAVELRWSTTWVDDIAQVNKELGFPPELAGVAFTLPHGVDTTREQVSALKIEAARKAAADGRAVIWTDDEVIPADGPVREELEAAGALLIVPNSKRCLRPTDLDTIEKYLHTR